MTTKSRPTVKEILRDGRNGGGNGKEGKARNTRGLTTLVTAIVTRHLLMRKKLRMMMKNSNSMITMTNLHVKTLSRTQNQLYLNALGLPRKVSD